MSLPPHHSPSSLCFAVACYFLDFSKFLVVLVSCLIDFTCLPQKASEIDCFFGRSPGRHSWPQLGSKWCCSHGRMAHQPVWFLDLTYLVLLFLAFLGNLFVFFNFSRLLKSKSIKDFAIIGGFHMAMGQKLVLDPQMKPGLKRKAETKGGPHFWPKVGTNVLGFDSEPPKCSFFWTSEAGQYRCFLGFPRTSLKKTTEGVLSAETSKKVTKLEKLQKLRSSQPKLLPLQVAMPRMQPLLDPGSFGGTCSHHLGQCHSTGRRRKPGFCVFLCLLVSKGYLRFSFKSFLKGTMMDFATENSWSSNSKEQMLLLGSFEFQEIRRSHFWQLGLKEIDGLGMPWIRWAVISSHLSTLLYVATPRCPKRLHLALQSLRVGFHYLSQVHSGLPKADCSMQDKLQQRSSADAQPGLIIFLKTLGCTRWMYFAGMFVGFVFGILSKSVVWCTFFVQMFLLNWFLSMKLLLQCEWIPE